MTEQGTLRRSILLASAGIVTATILYLAFSAYNNNSHESPGLHRSNAVRRSRRRWRRGHAPRDLANDPVAEAIRHLHGRNAARQPYGRYENHFLIETTQEALEQGRYDLLPTNLEPMVHELAALRLLTASEVKTLHEHVESIFIQNFLTEEFPPGYMIGEDAESLVHALRSHGISEAIIRIMIERFDGEKPLTPVSWDLHEDFLSTLQAPAPADPNESVTVRDAIVALTGQPDDSDSDSSMANDDDASDPGGSQGMLDLLYHIAGEQAKRDGLIHREVRCDSCGTGPIRGIRYHCANCYDYDLCETCEAQQVHNKSHVFYKIRIPAPLRGHIKQVSPVWYPGNPNAFRDTVPHSLAKSLMDRHRIEKTEIDSLYEHFKCLAGHHMPLDTDPARLGMAISRKNFDYYFTTTSDNRSPPQSLIYDRIFAFYDANNDDLITFDEFVRGMSNLQNRTRAARAIRMFQGYDLDGDGYVSRRDFLRMLRAYYAWHKELHKETTGKQDELEEDIRDAIHGTQPISAAFGWTEYAAHVSRGGQDKSLNVNGDLMVNNGLNDVLQGDSDTRGDRARSIETAALRGQASLGVVRSFQQREGTDEPVVHLPFNGLFDSHSHYRPGDATEEDLIAADPTNHIYGWPPEDMPLTIDVVNSLGADIPVDEIMDPTDRARVIYAQSQRIEEQSNGLISDLRQCALEARWCYRQFYLDEEEGLSKPPGYTEPDSSDDESISTTGHGAGKTFPTTNTGSRRQSMRSRSSSKVRFDDSAIDTDHETRSNTSSRSVPVNERWGGYELGESEKDIGKEILYQTIQQGFNQLLDPLFTSKEEEALVAMSTKKQRLKWELKLASYRARLFKAAEEEQKVQDSPGRKYSETSNSSVRPQKLSPEQDLLYPNQFASDAEITTERVNNKLDSVSADLTLPHLRPNDDFTTSLLASSNDLSEGTGTNHDKEPALPPSEATLATWLKHESIELEAIARGGYGRLSFREFKQKMVKESIGEVHNTFVTDNDDDDEEHEIWTSTADLGKLSFLGNWLEMARF